MPIRFDNLEIDLAMREVRLAGSPIGMEPKVFDLLVFLVQNADHVVTRDDVIQNVWGGRIVSDATVSSCIKSVRNVLGDDGKTQRYIRTIHGRGFRFVGAFLQPEAGVVTPANAPGPSLAVLPLTVYGDDIALDRVSDGLVDELLTVLTRVPLLSLVSRRSSFALKGKQLSAKEIHDQLNVTYLLEGTIQRNADSVRVHLQLVRAETDFHSWAHRFEVPNSGFIGEALFSAILPRLETALVETMVADLTEQDGVRSTKAQLIHAMGLLSLKGWNRPTFIEAETVLRDLLEKDPDQAVARAYLALVLGLGSRIGMFEASADVVARTIAEAEHALDLAGNDSTVLGLAGCALADVGQPDRAIPLLRKALELNPNNAQAWVGLGAALLLVVQYEEAVSCLEKGIEISAMDAQIAIWRSFLAIAKLLLGQVDAAFEHAQAGCQADDRNHIPRVVLAAVAHTRGERQSVRLALREALRINANLTDREVYRLAGPKIGEALIKVIQDLRA